MKNSTRVKDYRRAVQNKFNVFNSLFLSLPFRQIRNTGVLIPLLQSECRKGLNAGQEPVAILNSFFASRPGMESEDHRIDFMFRVIQYVERQIVLFDSVEDAAFPVLLATDDQVSLNEYCRLTEATSGKKSVDAYLSSFRTRIVFTAHPTQFYPPSVLKIIAKLRNFISANDISGIDRTLQQLGLTSLLKPSQPTPLEEAQNIIYFLRNVYYDAVGELYQEVKSAAGEDGFDNTRIIQLGFWPGGDRDGNPFVTSGTTMAVADELRMTLMKCYYRDLKDLESKLTFRRVEEKVSTIIAAVYEAMFNPEAVLSLDRIIDPLLEIRVELVAEYNGLYLEEVNALIDKVAIFKTHFASIDIRQNHAVHKRVITEILKKYGLIQDDLEELKADELIDILLEKDFDVRADDYPDDLIRDTIKTIAHIRLIQEKNGEPGCNRYVISNSEDIFSVLFVFSLLRWCSDDREVRVDIIPLFESVAGMAHAGSIMESLFNLPRYRSHVRRRNDTQTMMLGFSDGTKDGGYLRANWSIQRTKEELSSVCHERGIQAIFFDGRGGPPARGGGKTHRFYASQSSKIANHAIELTIQGQVITSKFGTREQFKHQCEELIAAGLHKKVLDRDNIINAASRDLIDDLARISYEKYTALKDHSKFIPYLERMSTLRYYSRAKVGSRPATRGSHQSLSLKNLRAIPFVGSWSQLKQNVPGYFGIGSALKHFVDEGRLDDLQALFRDVPFFKTLLLNSMMSLSKCSFELTNYIASNNEFGAFWGILLEEFELSKEMVLLVSGYTELMEEEPISKRSIEIREDIVLPLLVIQQYALQKIESSTDRKAVYEKIVTRSLYGNINASRNSA